MKVEQACRFRLDSGYGISARSAGFDSEQEKALGEVFNDTMNPVISKMGSSVLSCATRGQYAFWARSTLRTDIHNRTTIFTHSYVLPLRDYITMLEQAPQLLLCTPMSRLMDTQSAGEIMDTVEFPAADCAPLVLDALFEKYHLTAERYATLLLGAYEALTNNRSLRLYTTLPVGETEEMVRELTYCVLDGLLPSMKKLVTFSSGADSRMRINVIHSTAGLSGDEQIFGVEDNQYTNIRPRDALRAQLFQTLGAASREQRLSYLEQIEDCLSEMTNIENGVSVLLIAAAFARRCTQLTPDSRIALFHSFAGAAGKSLDFKIANKLLVELVQEMIDTDTVGTRELSNIAEWYLLESSQEFQDLADGLFRQASEEICVALEEAILKLEITSNAHRLLCVLVNRVEPDSQQISDELRSDLMRWIVCENVSELLFFCNASLLRYKDAQMKALVCDTLESTQGQTLSQIQLGIMNTALTRLTDSALELSAVDLERLDSHIGEYDSPLMDTAARYLFQIRIPKISDISDAADLLMKLSKVHPELKARIEKILPQTEPSELWEEYQCRAILPDDVDFNRIPELCMKHNSFGISGGPFEKRAFKLWIGGISQTINSLPDDLEQTEALTVKYLSESNRLRISQSVKERIKDTVASLFWNKLSFESIIKHNKTVHYEIVKVTNGLSYENILLRYKLMTACGRIKKSPGDSLDLVMLMLDMPQTHPDFAPIMTHMQWLLRFLIHNYQCLSLDVLLLMCRQADGEFDYDAMGQCLKHTQGWLEINHKAIPKCNAAESEILKSHPQIRKAITKKFGSALNGEPSVTQALVQSLQRKIPSFSRPVTPNRTAAKQPPKPSTPTRQSSGGSDPRSKPAGNPFAEQKAQQKEGGLFGKLLGGGKSKK